MTFAHLLDKHIGRSGLTKKEIASKMNIKPEYLIAIIKGRTNPPTPERLEQLATILKLSDLEKKKFNTLALEGRQNDKDRLLQQMAGESSAKTIEIKDIKIPVVSMAKGDDIEGFEIEQLEVHEYEYIDFGGCKAVRIKGNSMAPLAYDNQRVIYSESEHIKDGDLVFIKLKKRGQFFKRYHKDQKNAIVTLLSINVANHGPLNTKIEDIEFAYKVVGVKF